MVKADTVYCPYTDRELPEAKTNREHIIPLSLGGVDGFELPVSAAFNSDVGSELDGALANEFLFALRRTEYDARGHSRKPPMATIRRSTYGDDGRPAQVHFHKKEGVKVWDAKDREFKGGEHTIRVNTRLSIDLPVRFVAKVALSAGYLVYQGLFRNHVDHRQLRDVMRTDPAKLDLAKGPTALGLDHLTLRVDNYLHAAPTDLDSHVLWLRMFCASVRGSVVVLITGRDSFGVGVGILGQYVGMVNVPAATTDFPKKGVHRWGHVLAIVDGQLKRCSWADGLERWGRLAVGQGTALSR